LAGRRNFLVYDLDSETFEVAGNQQNLNVAQGAGIPSAEAVVRLGTRNLLIGNCGPKPFCVLAAAGVKIYTTNALTVAAAFEQFRLGKLAEAHSVDTEGHGL
jgi:predicted Fe-Mo cluster-binding NifX family protein